MSKHTGISAEQLGTRMAELQPSRADQQSATHAIQRWRASGALKTHADAEGLVRLYLALRGESGTSGRVTPGLLALEHNGDKFPEAEADVLDCAESCEAQLGQRPLGEGLHHRPKFA